MKCATCSECEPHPEVEGMCIYGGPFGGYIDVTTEAGAAWYRREAERARDDNYPDA